MAEGTSFEDDPVSERPSSRDDDSLGRYLDGVPLDNTVFASSAQRFGLGGFDYGSPLGDLDLSTIASINFLSGPQAAARYHSQADAFAEPRIANRKCRCLLNRIVLKR